MSSIQLKLLEMKKLMMEKKKIGITPNSEAVRTDSTPEPLADSRRDEQIAIIPTESVATVVEPEASPREAEPVEHIPSQQTAKQSSPPQELEEGEAVEERASNPIPPVQNIGQDTKPLPNLPIIPEKPQQSLELVQANCNSYSVEQDIRHNLSALQQKAKEGMAGESKTEKKEKKIVLKELTRIKECIRNLQGVVKGLEYVEGRVKHNPAMRNTIRNYLKEMSNA